MNRRAFTAIAFLLLATPALALERSPNDRGVIGGRDRQGASSERGERGGGDRGRTRADSGGSRSGRSYPQRERSGGNRDR